MKEMVHRTLAWACWQEGRGGYDSEIGGLSIESVTLYELLSNDDGLGCVHFQGFVDGLSLWDWLDRLLSPRAERIEEIETMVRYSQNTDLRVLG